MLSSGQAGLSMQVATVLVPMAAYFFMLGVLNSRSIPQLIRSRTEFFCLTVAFAPAFCMPVLACLGASSWTVVAMLGTMMAGAALLMPSRGSWVICNISSADALDATERALRAMGRSVTRRKHKLLLDGAGVAVSFAPLPLLRNVAVTVTGDGEPLGESFERNLAQELGGVRAGVSPVASALVMIAIAMMVAPLALFADQMPEMVRLLTDLVK